MNKILSILKIDLRASEKTTFSLLSFNSFFTGFSTAFFFVSSSSYFIKNLSVGQLPMAFIFSGIAGFLLIQGYKKLVHWKGLILGNVSISLLYIIICSILFCLRFYGGKSHTHILIVSYLGFISIMPFMTVFALVFSSINFAVFDLSQGKRLTALLGLGEIMANCLSYIVIPSLVKYWGGSEYLLLVSIGAIIVSLIPIIKIKIPQKQLVSKVELKVKNKVSLFKLTKDPYYLMIIIVTFFSVSSIFLVDYSYLLTVKFITSKNNIDSAILVSLIFCLIKLGELVTSIYSSRFHNSFGLFNSLLILPILLTISSFIGFFSSIILPFEYLIIITFLLINKWVERAVRKGILGPSQKVLFQVSEPEERSKIQTQIEGSFTQISTISSGFLLYLFSYFYQSLSQHVYLILLALICLLFSILWIFFTKKVYANYKDKIQQFLNQGIFIEGNNTEGNNKIQEWKNAIPIKEKELSYVQEIYSNLVEMEVKVLKNSKQFYFNQIKNYNEYEFKNSDSLSEEDIYIKCNKVFFQNNSFESRASIIIYSKYFKSNQKLEFIRENYSNLNYHLQYLLLVEIFKGKEAIKLDNSTDRFYISELCIECCQIIFWFDLAIEDLNDIKSKKLVEGLSLARRFKVFHLFELLKFVYNPSAISIISNIWKTPNNSNESQLFTVELLENLLDGELKKIIIPLLMDIPTFLKKEKLLELLGVNNLDYSNRLIDIMLKNIHFIDPYLKELASLNYVAFKSDSKILKYYRDNSNFRLNALSQGGVDYITFKDYEFFFSSKFYLSTNIIPIFLFEFLIQSFFSLNPQLVSTNNHKSNVTIFQKENHGNAIKLNIEESTFYFPIFNLYLLFLLSKNH